jgi:hypothetical protein
MQATSQNAKLWVETHEKLGFPLGMWEEIPFL